MSAPALLAEAERLGVELYLADGRVRYRAPRGADTPAFLERLRLHKDAVLRHLLLTALQPGARIRLERLDGREIINARVVRTRVDDAGTMVIDTGFQMGQYVLESDGTWRHADGESRYRLRPPQELTGGDAVAL